MIVGSNANLHFLRREEGIRSRSQQMSLDSSISFEISSTEAGMKKSNFGGVWGQGIWGEVRDVSDRRIVWILWILDEKNKHLKS